jgi:hypothetical protein
VLEFYAFNKLTKEAWKFRCSVAWYKKHDNGFAVSIGFRVPEDVSYVQLAKLKAKRIPYEQWARSS